MVQESSLLFNVLSISDDAFTYYSREWLFRGKNNDRKIDELISGNLGGKPTRNSHRNQFFSAFLIPVGIGCCSAKVLMQVVENCSLFIKQNQVLQDAEF